MGGGDLNLKKSWHPSTLRNIERVWKAEQKHDAEQKKIEQLQKELAEEKAKEDMRNYAENQGVVKRKNDRLDWMYQGPAALVDRDQYLMGRRVDTTFELLEKMENKDQAPVGMDFQQPGAIFDQAAVSVTVDLANKIREDPLFAIRKRETEQMKSLLKNPVKMKQLRDILQQSVTVKDKKKKKKKKDKKEKRKKKHRSSSSSEEESISRSSKHSHHHHHRHEASPDRAHDEEQTTIMHRSYIKTENEDKPRSKQYGLILGERARERWNGVARQRSRSPVQKKTSNDVKVKRERTPPRKKLTGEEMERRRKEMMEDARCHQEQVTKNVRRYEEEDQKESQKNSHDRSKESQFYKPMLNKAADAGSVESRIKQKVYKIQRSRSAMNENFVRR